MKTLLIASVLAVFSLAAFSQQIDMRRKIHVTGSAETEVTPDIIYFGISLREYFRDAANKKKVEIEELEKQLQTAVINAGIPAENFTINNIAGYNYILERKKNPGFLVHKQYRIKVTDLSKLNDIISSVDPKGIEYTNIEGYDHSRIEAIKKEVKIKALQAARDKAAYLAEAINTRLGDVLDIQEINNEYYPPAVYRANVMMREGMAQSGAASPIPDIDFKKIKLTYQMNTVFELK